MKLKRHASVDTLLSSSALGLIVSYLFSGVVLLVLYLLPCVKGSLGCFISFHGPVVVDSLIWSINIRFVVLVPSMPLLQPLLLLLEPYCFHSWLRS